MLNFYFKKKTSGGDYRDDTTSCVVILFGYRCMYVVMIMVSRNPVNNINYKTALIIAGSI